ncbi:unnamed protein product, partial [Leptidea sinapis]
MVFPLPGASVDLSQSDHHQVRIVNLNRRLSGDYQCEVSADAPLFHTDIRSAPLTVVDPPFRAPLLAVSQRNYIRGDVITANCTVDEAFPAPNITWILDDQKIAETVSSQAAELDLKERAAFSQLQLSVLEVQKYELGLSYTRDRLDRSYHPPNRESSRHTDSVSYNVLAPESGQFTLSCVATIHNIYARQSEVVIIREDAPQPASVTGENSA